VRQECHQIACQARQRLDELTGLAPVCGEAAFRQMFSARLPEGVDLEALKVRLYEEFQIEVPLIHWNGQNFVRVSVQGYNNPEDAGTLVDGLRSLLP
jgi:aspartate aminotransferase-like enzyme